jgi:hypothetical protein
VRTSIRPGRIWLDTDGNRIAHGGSLLGPRVLAGVEQSIQCETAVEHA